MNCITRGARYSPCKADTTGILLEGRVIQTLLHGQGTSPRLIVLGLVLIGMVCFFLGIEVNLSVVEIRGQAHARRGYAAAWLEMGRVWDNEVVARDHVGAEQRV